MTSEISSSSSDFAGVLQSPPAETTKVAFDRVGAGLGLLALLPLFVLGAALIRWCDPGPVVYAHRRIGRGGAPFDCLKFRTMAVDGDALLEQHLAENAEAEAEWRKTRKLKDDPRITPFGRMLRKTSLDELPQLINVLRGEMSLVGPRPIVEEELLHYGDALEAYLSVRPGLTGLWQVSGRNDVDYTQRVSLDREYVQTRSFLGDLKIIAQTMQAVIRQKGSY